MQLCSHLHDEVVYETPLCPVCTTMAELDEEIRELEDHIEVLEDKLDTLIPIAKQHAPEALI